MQFRELSIPHAFEFTPTVHGDPRGRFLELYRFEALESAVGHPLQVKQANMSVSQRGVARGIHYASVPPGQAKYVTVSHGAVLDFIVDVREGSPTFGAWDSVLLDDESNHAVYLASGLGHAFVTLSASATVTYLVSEVFSPKRGGTQLARHGCRFGLSPKGWRSDHFIKKCGQCVAGGCRGCRDAPRWRDCVDYYEALGRRAG